MNVVLVEPEIHFNTGNIGRTCVGTGSTLHLVGRLGFSLDSAQIRRSGLDYWPDLDLKVHHSFEAFLRDIPKDASLLFYSAEAEQCHWDAPYRPDSYLIFGKESVGLPPKIRTLFQDSLYRVPQSNKIRSLNLSTAAGVVLYEALRQTTDSDHQPFLASPKPLPA